MKKQELNKSLDIWLTAPDSGTRRVAVRRKAVRLSTLAAEWFGFLEVERRASKKTLTVYKWCFKDFQDYTIRKTEKAGGVNVPDFTTELCRGYQYDMAERKLAVNTVRLRLAVLASFGRWAVRRDRLLKNPMDMIIRPRKRNGQPKVPKWAAVEDFLDKCSRYRDKAILALLAYGGLRRSEVVSLDVRDFDPGFGLRRVQRKGNHDSTVVLPEVARRIVAEYLRRERPGAMPGEPLFLVRYKKRVGQWEERRMDDHRVWKLVKDLGARHGAPELHPHAFRHACGVELLKRNGGNLRVVQDHLGHEDIATTVIYTRLLQEELQKAVSVFDRKDPDGDGGKGGRK
jgi:site-specific recombinase XerD